MTKEQIQSIRNRFFRLGRSTYQQALILSGLLGVIQSDAERGDKTAIEYMKFVEEKLNALDYVAQS